MIFFTEIVFILVVHWLADFVLQTHEQASKKSTSGLFLFYHVSTYTLVWLLLGFFMYGEVLPKIAIFAGVTFVAHFTTDFVTSRIVKKFYDKEDYHNVFVTIGFDQILHYFQLFVTYIWLRG